MTARLDALLALELDRHLRTYPDAGRRKDRTLDALLADAGVGTADIAQLLGKTQRAVNLQLEKR